MPPNTASAPGAGAAETATGTIVVPSHDRPEALRRCLEHLAALEEGPWPVIVVDDGSPEPAATAYREICAGARSGGLAVDLVRRDRGGPGAARNTGAAAARSRWLLFTDDDCRPRPDWARRLAAAQGGVPLRLVGGRIDNALVDDVFAAASQSLAGYLYHHYQSRGSEMAFFTTNNLCCLRRDFLAIGGFDAAFGAASEDRDLSLRWRDAGGTLVHLPEAVVDHAHHLSLGAFWRQHHAYGQGAHRLHRRMDGRGDARPKLEALGFYAHLVAWPLTRAGRRRPEGRTPLPRAVAEAGLLGLSQLAMVSGYVHARRREGASAPHGGRPGEGDPR